MVHTRSYYHYLRSTEKFSANSETTFDLHRMNKHHGPPKPSIKRYTDQGIISRRISRPSTPIIPPCPHTNTDRKNATIHVCNRLNVPISARGCQHISAQLITPAAPPTRARKAFFTQTYYNVKNSQVPHPPYPVTYIPPTAKLSHPAPSISSLQR